MEAVKEGYEDGISTSGVITMHEDDVLAGNSPVYKIVYTVTDAVGYVSATKEMTLFAKEAEDHLLPALVGRLDQAVDMIVVIQLGLPSLIGAQCLDDLLDVQLVVPAQIAQIPDGYHRTEQLVLGHDRVVRQLEP